MFFNNSYTHTHVAHVPMRDNKPRAAKHLDEGQSERESYANTINGILLAEHDFIRDGMEFI